MDNVFSMFVEALCLACMCAVISCTLIVLIPNEPIVNWWFRLGSQIGVKIEENREVERWFYKPIWGCERCFAGQLSLWVFVYNHLHIRTGTISYLQTGYSISFCVDRYFIISALFAALLSVIISALLSIFLKIIINKAE